MLTLMMSVMAKQIPDSVLLTGVMSLTFNCSQMTGKSYILKPIYFSPWGHISFEENQFFRIELTMPTTLNEPETQWNTN